MAQSAVTLDLLREAGYKYVLDWPADDQPFWMRTRSGPLLSVPYSLELNDSPVIVFRQEAVSNFEKMIIDQFDEMIQQSERHALVCGIALHTMIVGQPYRTRALRRALKYIVDHPLRDKIWFTRPGEIFDYCANLKAGIVPGSKN